MLNLSLPTEIFLCLEPTDLRCGFDRLSQRASEHARRNVRQGGLYVFLNRRRDRLKLLYWDADGLALWYKRLEAGTFQLPIASGESKSVALRPSELALILSGIDLTSVRRRKRFLQPTE
jgi:transposase